MRTCMIPVAALLAAASAACGQFDEPAYDASMTFLDGGAGNSTTMTLAFDGTSFWSCNGGYSNNPMHQYDADGNLVATFDVPLDQRSVFTDGVRVYIRPYSDNTIYMQGSPGDFSPYITLNGGSLESQAAVVYTGSEYISNNYGLVDRWDDNGNYIGSFSLSGFGGQNDESAYPQGRGIAFGGGYYLTYSNGVLSAWDDSGNRLDTTVLNGAGQGFDSHFSLSYTNDKFWVVDVNGGEWRGYSVLPRGNPCYADFTEDGELDLFDFLAFVNAFNAGEDAADCDGNGAFDLFDFLCFTNSFNAGC